MSSLSLIVKLIKIYSSYGVIHVFVKILKQWLQARRMRLMLEPVPQARYEEGVLGVVPMLIKNMHRRHDMVDEITAGLPMSKLCFGPPSDPRTYAIQVRDPAVIKHFLKDNFEKYTKPPSDRNIFFQNLRVWLGEGIFVARHGSDAPDKGQNWSKQRKIAANIFSRGNFNNNMCDVFVAKAKRFCDILKEPASSGQKVDMQQKFFQYTMDSIMQIFFGENVDTLGGETNQYALAFDTAHRCVVEYNLRNIPILTLIQLLPWPFGGFEGLGVHMHRASNPLFKEFNVALNTLHVESRRIIEGSRADPRIEERKDLLALFMNHKEKPSAKDVETVSSEPPSTEWLRDLVLNFILAGRDTTACTLSWMFYILSTNPEIQAKAQAEIDAKLAADATPTMQSVSPAEMPYLHGLLYEVLRLYPPVPVDGKEAVEDDVMPDGTKIPKGVNMDFLVYAMGRDPAVYPDPEVVRPERWIPFKEPSQYEFPVFQGGPRICLGMAMAIFEAKVLALMLLREYSFELLAGEKEKIGYLPTAVTMSICNSGGDKFDSHNLWLIPRAR